MNDCRVLIHQTCMLKIFALSFIHGVRYLLSQKATRQQDMAQSEAFF